MTQKDINKAYTALMRLSDFRLPIKKAREIYTITKKAEEHFKFAIREERKYIEALGGVENADGTITFKSSENFEQFQKNICELNESEVDWNGEPVVITDTDIGEQTISPSDIRCLEAFISFE